VTSYILAAVAAGFVEQLGPAGRKRHQFHDCRTQHGQAPPSLAPLAAYHKIPTIYPARDFVLADDLIAVRHRCTSALLGRPLPAC
jgi:hypothetical protein